MGKDDWFLPRPPNILSCRIVATTGRYIPRPLNYSMKCAFRFMYFLPLTIAVVLKWVNFMNPRQCGTVCTS